MLEFSAEQTPAKILAIYYAGQINDKLALQVLNKQTDITSSEQAIRFTESFWKMIDLAIVDNKNNAVIEGISEIEFWMLKLYNKVLDYLHQKGFQSEWAAISNTLACK